MNKLKRILLLTFSLVIVASLALVAGGCKGKNKKATLSFETNGGAAIASVELDKGSEYELPVPTKTDGEFAGWYTDAGFSGESVTKVTVNEDTTVYAKWIALYAVNFDLAGGTLSGSSAIYLKSGANVYDAVKDLTPTKADSLFGAWTVNGSEISSSLTMTEGGMTLTAKYKTKYVVEIYKQNLEGSAYAKEEDAVVGYEYAGVKPTKEFSFTGFKLNSSAEGSVPVDKIKENASENVFRLYFDRESYSVTFRPNYPDGTVSANVVYNLKYGEDVEVPYDYACAGYYLAGWSTSAIGDVEYAADYISTVLFNKTDDDTHGNAKVAPTKNLVLYGVWVKGNVDMFGGEDSVFVSANDPNVVYICRAGIFFKGNYNADKKTFNFRDANDDIVLEGKIFDDGTFAYSNDIRNGASYSLYRVGSAIDDKTAIYLDQYNGIIYSVKTGSTTVDSKGTYTIDENGCLISTFTSGEMSGQTISIMLAQVTLNQTKTNVFLVRDEEEVNLGVMYRSLVKEGSLVYYTSVYTLQLNGFGTASFFTGSEYQAYTYVYDKESKIITLTTSSSSSSTKFRVVELSGKTGYVLYNEAEDTVYRTADGKSMLTLDGAYEASYVKDGVTVKGYYTSTSSLLGGTIYTMLADGKEYNFLVTSKTEQVTDDSGNTVTQTTYSFVERAAGYAEYYLHTAKGTYYGPLFVVNDTEVGAMSVYGYTVSKTYEKISEGTFVEQDGKYVYTPVKDYTDKIVEVVPYYEDEDAEEKVIAGYRHYIAGETEENVLWMVHSVNVKTLDTVTFGLGTVVIGSTPYQVSYWYSSTDKEGAVSDYVTVYDAANEGEGELTLVGGMAIYKSQGNVFTGAYQIAEGMMTVSVYVNGNVGNLYLEIDEENKTFSALETSPYVMYVRYADGTTSKAETLSVDGKGGAVYTVTTVDSEGQTQDKTVNGKVEATGETTAFGSEIMRFVAETEEDSFRYIRLQNSSNYFFTRYEGTYAEEYISADGILTLDGFTFMAKYVAADGTSVQGLYTVVDENVIRIIGEDRYYYFDVSADSFTKRGDEYGTYLYIDNGYFKGYYFYFDGYSVLTVREIVKNEEGENELVVVTEGTYSVSGNSGVLQYTVGADSFTLTGVFTSIVISDTEYRAFKPLHEEVVSTYVNPKDWSVLILDSTGTATKYDSEGRKDVGTYTLITSNLLYYVNGEESDACIYEFDKTTGRATMKTFRERGYYTSELESLLFSKYGFAIFNGKTRYYYTTEGSEYVIYHQPEEGEDLDGLTVNEYGFVREEFGEFTDVKEYKGKTYYRNSGIALSFNRNTVTGEGGEQISDPSYKVLYSTNADGTKNYCTFEMLTFTPSGEDVFSVDCVVSIDVNGTKSSLSGTVVKEKKEDGTYETYLLIGLNVGYYRFDLNVVYLGETEDGDSLSTYSITGLKRIISAPSYQFLHTYYLLYAYFGSTMGYTNQIGSIEIVYEYDAEGEMTESYVNGYFGSQSNLIDVNGRIVTMEKASFTYDSSTGIYTAEFKVKPYEAAEEGEVLPDNDEYTYRLYFGVKKHQAYVNTYGYSVYGFTRVQTLTDEASGCEVTVERMIYSEVSADSYPAGSIFGISLKKNGEDVKYDVRVMRDGVWSIAAREYAEDGTTIVSTTYYTVNLKEKSSGELGEESKIVPAYESVTVTETKMKTYYTEDGSIYVDVNEAGDDVAMLCIYNNGKPTYYAVSKTEKDENGVLTVTVSDGTVYKVEIKDGKAVVTKVETEN